MATKQQIEDDEVQNHESEYEDTEDREEEGSEESNRDEGENEDERLTESESASEDPEREAIRARRREERKHKKEAARERENVLRSELAARDQLIEQLASRLSAVEQRGVGSEIQQIDNALNQLASAYVSAKQYLEKGASEQDGKLVVEATERMQQIRAKAEELNNFKTQIANRAKIQSTSQQNQIDPRLKNYAEDWMKENSWYKHDGSDNDSRITSAIDDSLAREGWNPATPEYWAELTRRVKKELPHRYDSSYNREGKKRSPVVGSSRASTSASHKDYQLSPDRVSAMKEAGVWDDPKKRAKMIEAYKKYDKENAQ